MRGGVRLWLPLAVAVALWTGAVWAHRCDRTPDGQVSARVPADGRFVLKVNGAPDTYVPGGEYTISLSGQRNQGQVQQKFTGFTLVVESQYKGPLRAMSPRDFMPRPVGDFHLQGDTLTKFSPNCINMVTHTSSMPKPDISVRWTAPTPGSGCVIFRATVVEHRDVWYQDDGPLSRVLCEQEQESLDTQPDILDQCCACDEAKYEVTFEGLWSRHTHPKDFPSNSWLTRFSDVIGASHSTNYRFWEYGGFSSDGLAQVAEHGSTRLLESELKSQSQHIRTIIKARGISYPNVTGKTFAVFRVDKVHHLMSLVSMIDPSPDWIVGVSALELCMANCSWADSKVLNLYPWDAGTDSGLSYISPDQNTDPREKIRRITTSFPNDPRSPFYDASGVEMKPLAKLYLTRQRLYEKTCEEETIPKSNDVCATTEWSDWGECSATCGRGNRHRQRHYLRPQNSRFCHERLSISQPCNVGHCMPTLHSHVTIEPINPECEVTEWGDWSRCKPTDAACTRGSQQRYRQVHARSRKKYCVSVAKLDQRECTPSSSPSVCPTIPTGSKPKVQYKDPQSSTCCADQEQDQDKDYGTEPNETEEAENEDGDNTDLNKDNETVDAEEEEGRENEEDYDNGDGNNGLDNQGGGEADEKSGENEVTEPSGECAMSQWSEWSPCDPRCGPGTSSRERAPLHLSGRRRRRRETTDADYGDYGVESVPESEDVEFGPEPCSAYPVLQRVACNGTDPSCEISTDQAQEVCALTAHPGLCPGPMVMRWHYDPALEDCREFQWTGCRGNLNRFLTLDACRKACESFTVELKAQRAEKLQKYGVSISGIMSYEIQLFEKCTANVTEEDELTTTEETTTEDRDMIGRSQIRGQLRASLGEEAMEGTEKPVRHCKFSRWSEWSECDAPCGKQGVKERTRRIEVHARNGGKACNGKTRKQKKCIRRCKPDEDGDKSDEGNADCKYSEWSQWSECTATCGYSAIRQRTRRVLRGNPAECNDRLRKQHCNVGLCH